MDPLKLTNIGKTDVSVSALGVGGAPFGQDDIKNIVAVESISKAMQYGINYFDTAPIYGNGQSERYYGTAFEKIPRSKFVVSSKVGRYFIGSNTFSGINKSQLQLVTDYSKDGILRSIEDSLDRLKLEYIDIALVHDPDFHVEQAINETFPTLVDLKSQGIIKAIGAGANNCEPLVRFARSADVDCFLIAGRYTLLEQSALKELFPICSQKNISIILGGPYNSGILADPNLTSDATYFYEKTPKDVLGKIRRINDICNRHKVPLKAAALQFGLMHPVVISTIPGIRSVNELIENVDMVLFKIDSKFWDELKFENII